MTHCMMAHMTGERCDEDSGNSLATAIDNLLACVERPVGSLKPHIPQSPASERAIIAIYDAVGRTL